MRQKFADILRIFPAEFSGHIKLCKVAKTVAEMQLLVSCQKIVVSSNI